MKDKNDIQVFIMPNLKEMIELSKNINKNDYYEVDEVNWKFTHNQLTTLENFSKEDRENYLVQNLQPGILIHARVLIDIIDDKINETCQEKKCNPEDLIISNLSINIDNEYNRHIEMRLDTINEVKELGLFDYNQIMKEKIEVICRDSLSNTLDNEKLEEFIQERIEEFEEEEYSIDYLEGIIDGYLLHIMETEDKEDDF